MKTALVLGGGGARGLAHVGVLKVLDKEGLRPDLIVGCSIGSIVGGMYAQMPDSAWVERRLREFFSSTEYENLQIGVLERRRSAQDEDDFIHQIARNLMKRVLLNMVVSRQSILKNDQLNDALEFLLKKGDITKTKIPFACNATDLVNGKPVLFTAGDIQQAVKASSSIPGYLPPVATDSQLLVDGAVTYALPIPFARTLGADFVIAVDVRQKIKPQNDFKNVFDILFRSSAISSSILEDEIASDADILLQPDVGDFFWYDFQKMDDFIRAGEAAAYQKIADIRETMHPVRKSLWKRLLKLK